MSNSSNILELSLRLQDPIATYEQQHHIYVPWLSTKLVFSVFADAVLDPTSWVISFESTSDYTLQIENMEFLSRTYTILDESYNHYILIRTH